MNNQLSAMADSTAVFNYFALAVAYRSIIRKDSYLKSMAEALVKLASRDRSATEQDYRGCFRYYVHSAENFKQAWKDYRAGAKKSGYLLADEKAPMKPAKAFVIFSRLLDNLIPLLIAGANEEDFLTELRKEI